LQADIFGPHSQHVAPPSRYRLAYSGRVLGAMSSAFGQLADPGTDMRIDVDRKQQASYNISLPLSGNQELRTASGILLSDSDRGLVMSPNQPFELGVAGNCQKILVNVQRSVVDQTLSDLLGSRVDEQLVFAESMDTLNGSVAAWWRLIKHHLAEIERSPELYGNAYFRQAIETTLVRGLLISQASN
jgi:hypothetical protein